MNFTDISSVRCGVEIAARAKGRGDLLAGDSVQEIRDIDPVIGRRRPLLVPQLYGAELGARHMP
jgi:hypothetical protein